MNDIFILWPTARPEQAANTAQLWFENAASKGRLRFYFNTTKASESLQFLGNKVLVDDKASGVCNALHALCSDLTCDETDVVVVASDDVYAPLNWDVLIAAVLRCKPGMLWVDDGWHKDRNIIAVPICDGGTFNKLNKIIYHPSYNHLWADNELWQNCKDLDLLVDMRENLLFEHKHYYAGKRHTDEVDAKALEWQEKDRQNWIKRSKLSVQERLAV